MPESIGNLKQVLSMIRCNDNECVIEKALVVKKIYQPPNLSIYVTETAIV
jgi:hypothetical protein